MGFKLILNWDRNFFKVLLKFIGLLEKPPAWSSPNSLDSINSNFYLSWGLSFNPTGCIIPALVLILHKSFRSSDWVGCLSYPVCINELAASKFVCSCILFNWLHFLFRNNFRNLWFPKCKKWLKIHGIRWNYLLKQIASTIRSELYHELDESTMSQTSN